jgi:hypothetical protein
MGLYQKMQTSSRLESEGIWLQIDDTRIRLSRAGGKNTKFIAAAEKIQREHKRALDLIGEEQGRKIFGKIFAEIIVLDWLTRSDDGLLDEDGEVLVEPEKVLKINRWKRGISGPNGELVEFLMPKTATTVENILKTFDDIPDLLRMVKETAEDASLFRQDLLKGIEGNS